MRQYSSIIVNLFPVYEISRDAERGVQASASDDLHEMEFRAVDLVRVIYHEYPRVFPLYLDARLECE